MYPSAAIRTLNATLGLAVAMALGSAAHAAPIVTSQLTNNEAVIVNTGGGVVSAANFGSMFATGGVSTLTVDINGIVHPVASEANGGDGADLIANASINSTFDGHFRDYNANAVGYSGDLRNLMGGIAGNPSPGPLNLDMTGLTPGTTYLFQGYWEANNYNQTITVTFEGADTLAGISGNGMGTLISYQFVAGDDTLNLSITKTAGTDNVFLQGYSLQVVPEPGSMALLGIGGLLMLRPRGQ